MTPSEGLTIAGRYRLSRKVGAGGMGEVWAASDLQSGKEVALKLLSTEGEDRAGREALLREARTAQLLRHPNILEIREVLEVDGQPVLVMDLLEGETLAALLQRSPRLTIAELRGIALPVVSALGAAHEAGVVHRDLKPENIFLTTEKVLVLDFGIARRNAVGVKGTFSATTATTNALTGTPEYMSPEQLYGEADLDHRADLWSLGIVLYQCLAGFLPTRGDNKGQVIKAVTSRPFQPIANLRPDAPRDLTRLVDRLLARDKESRPGDAREVFGVMSGLSNLDAALPILAPARAETKARPWPLVAAGAVAAAVAALALLNLRRPPALSATPRTVACPPWRVSSANDGDRWLGIAAAATACERIRVLLGGGAGLTLTPAELLDLPRHPFDRDDGRALETASARETALQVAGQRGADLLDGEVAREPGGFSVQLGGASFGGASLYEAVKAALEDREKRGLLLRASSLDPAWAEWSRARDVDGALALLDLTFAIAQNAQSLERFCQAVADSPGIDGAMKQFAAWECAYTRGLPAAAPRIGGGSPGAMALSARASHSASREDSKETIAAVQKLLAAERSPLGRSTLAATISCLLQSNDPEGAAAFARRAVGEEPRNFLGEFCAPWGQVLVTTSDTASSQAAARAMRAWAPWDSSGWYWPPGDSAGSVEFARRAYQLSPFDTNVANQLVDRLLAAGSGEEARTVALALSSGPDPVHRLAGDLIQVRLDSIDGKVARSRERALIALRAASDADSGFVRVQRLDLGLRAVEAAEMLGDARTAADEVTRTLIVRDPPLLDGSYLTVPAEVPAICARCSPAMARRCFDKFAAMKSQLSGGILGGTAAFADGARLWAKGDRAAAAEAFRPLLAEPSLYAALLPLAMAQSFDAAGDDEAVKLLAASAEQNAPQLHGAMLLHAFLATRADRRGDKASACALSTRVVKAWSTTDAAIPALRELRQTIARTCPTG